MSRKSALDDVLGVLREADDSLSTGKIVEVLSGEYAESTIRNAVSKLHGQGELEKVSHGVYRIAPYEPIEAGNDVVQIPLTSIRANAGEGQEPFQERVERYVTFDRDAIKRETNADPSDLTMIAVTGDSMQPTLNPGDRVLVARHRKGEPLISGSIYIWRSHLRGIIVKRLRWKDDQTVVLESDNDRGPTIEVDMKDENEHGWEVLGRVVRVEKHL